ncbi:MAG: hypothetical protein AB1791_13165 [Chloroflexota bacterium]
MPFQTSHPSDNTPISLAVADVQALVRLEDEGRPLAGQLLQRALMQGVVPSGLIGELLAKREQDSSADVLLQRIAKDEKWDVYRRGLSESGALAWLQAIPPEQRRPYYQNNRDTLYNTASLVTQEAPLPLLYEITRLPAGHNKAEEYAGLWRKAKAILKQKLPPALGWLVRGEAADGVDSFRKATRADEDTTLFLLAIEHTLENEDSPFSKQRPLPMVDLWQLYELSQGVNPDLPQRLLLQVIGRGWFSPDFIHQLIEKGDLASPILVAVAHHYAGDGSMSPVLPTDDALHWLKRIRPDQLDPYRRPPSIGDDWLYLAAVRSFEHNKSAPLLWQIIQHLPTLPDPLG